MSGKNKQPKGLGRGLEALFGEETVKSLHQQQPQAEPAAQEGFRRLPLRQIEPNREQPRKEFDPAALAELTESIRQHGVVSPITVRQSGPERYQIIAGERRWRAARSAGLAEIPAMIIEADEQTAMELALIENLQRQDLNPIEEAEGYSLLMEQFHLTQDVVAERVGKSRSAVANSLRLLGLTPSVRQLVAQGKLSGGHGKAILAAREPALQEQLARTAMEKRLSVRQTEALGRKLARPPRSPATPAPFQVDYTAELARQMETALGRRVRIGGSEKKGVMELEFYGPDDLERLSRALMEVNL